MLKRTRSINHRRRGLGIAIATVSLVLVGLTSMAAAQENEDCLMCHEDPELVGERGGKEVVVFVDPAAYAASVHADFACIDCHMDLDGAELPHDEELEAVDCAMCHDDMGEELAAGPHGKWAPDPSSPAAACTNCHGTHDVLPSSDPASSRVGSNPWASSQSSG